MTPMMNIHVPRLPRRLLAGAALLASSVLANPTYAQGVVATSALHNPDGSLAGFATSEPSLYFLAPSRWSPIPHSGTPPVRLTSLVSAGQTLYDLRLVLSPDYTRDTPTVVAIRTQDAHAVFFPLPMSVEHVTLFLPAALGSIQAELVPDELGLRSPVALYYRLRFNTEQLGVVRTLAHGGLTLQGTIQYAYSAPNGAAETATPLTIILNDADLLVSTAPPPDPTAWLTDLLTTTIFSGTGVLDGTHTLRSGLSFQITNSSVDAWLLPSSWVLQSGVNVLQIQPTQPEDFAGTIAFDVQQIGAHIRMDFRAALAISLDLSFMQLTITRFDITTTTVNGAPSAFYTALLKQLLQDPAVQADVSQALSDALQRRILAETLTMGDVLP